jgi:acyl carrier protein
MDSNGAATEAASGVDVRESIREFIKANIAAAGAGELRDDHNIFEKGFVTSIFAMQLLTHMENAFGVEVPDSDLTLANFSSVDRMVQLVDGLKADRA